MSQRNNPLHEKENTHMEDLITSVASAAFMTTQASLVAVLARNLMKESIGEPLNDNPEIQDEESLDGRLDTEAVIRIATKAAVMATRLTYIDVLAANLQTEDTTLSKEEAIMKAGQLLHIS